MTNGFQVKQCPRFIAEIQKNDSIQREINIVREASHITIGHLKDTPNKKNKIVERYKRELIEDKQNMGKGNHIY